VFTSICLYAISAYHRYTSSFFTAHGEVCFKLDALDREPVIAELVFNLSRKISADSFFCLSFEISAYSNGCHLGSKIISAQVTEQNILRSFFRLKLCNIG